MLQGEDDGVGHEHAAGLLGEGGRQDVGVDGEREVASARVAPQRGVLGAEELAQVFVEHKNQLGDACKTAETQRWDVNEGITNGLSCEERCIHPVCGCSTP